MGLLPTETIAECRSCGRRWPVFKGANAAMIEGAREESVETIETERSVEPHHTDPLELDNLVGTSPHNHTVTITQEWTQSVELDTEQAKVENTTSGAELPGVGTFGRKAESAVKSTYSVSEGTTKCSHGSSALRCRPGQSEWSPSPTRGVWQHGLARVANPDGAVAEIPFKVAVDMTVNVAQRDTKT
jgi:hypothetical protein